MMARHPDLRPVLGGLLSPARRWAVGLMRGFVIFIALLLLVLGLALVALWQGGAMLRNALAIGRVDALIAALPEPADPAALGTRSDPSEALGLAFETLTIPAPPGPLPAWLIPGDPGASTAAIYVHGIGGARQDGYRYIASFHDAGIPILLLGYRNDAEAPRDPSGLRLFGLTEWEDLAAAVTLMRARGFSSLVLIGDSMGGGIIGQYLRRSGADGIAALVLDAPALSFETAAAHLSDVLGSPAPGFFTRIGLWGFWLREGIDLSRTDVRAELTGFPRPLLLIHGRSDRVVPIDTSRALAAARREAGHATSFLRTRGDHLQSYPEDPARFHAALAEFLASLASRRD